MNGQSGHRLKAIIPGVLLLATAVAMVLSMPFPAHARQNILSIGKIDGSNREFDRRAPFDFSFEANREKAGRFPGFLTPAAGQNQVFIKFRGPRKGGRKALRITLSARHRGTKSFGVRVRLNALAQRGAAPDATITFRRNFRTVTKRISGARLKPGRQNFIQIITAPDLTTAGGQLIWDAISVRTR